MATQDKLVSKEPVKSFVTAVSGLRKSLKQLNEVGLGEESIDEKTLLADPDDMLKVIKEHFNNSFINMSNSKQTVEQFNADLTELWTVVKLLKGIRTGLMSREGLLGLSDD